MKMRYIVNGWSESPSYFFSLVEFTWEEIKLMVEEHKIIVKREVEFRIELVP